MENLSWENINSLSLYWDGRVNLREIFCDFLAGLILTRVFYPK